MYIKDKTIAGKIRYEISAISHEMSLKLNKKKYVNEDLKSSKKSDKSDYERRISPLKRTKDQYLISSENESKRSCFLKIKKITIQSQL